MRHVESTTQQAFIRWFRLAYARYALVAVAVPNGGARSRVEAAIMQGEGVTAGVADVLVLVPRGGYGALGLEFKTTARSSRQSPSQKAWQQAFEAAGNRYHVVRTIDEAIEVTNDYMQNNDKNERKTLHKRHEQDLADGGRAARRAVAAAQSEI